MPRELVYAPGHDRSRSLGLLAAAWVEHFTIHGPGDVQGEPTQLDDEFAGFLTDAYALGDNGRRLYNRAALVRPKGQGQERACRVDRAVGGVRAVPVRRMGTRRRGLPVAGLPLRLRAR